MASLLARKTPMVAAVAAGVLWCALPILSALQHHFYGHLPADIALIITGTIVGGMLDAKFRRSAPLAN